MSSHDGDPRVTANHHEWFTVMRGGRRFWVNKPGVNQRPWFVYDADAVGLVAGGFETADEAIASLIGEPQVAP